MNDLRNIISILIISITSVCSQLSYYMHNPLLLQLPLSPFQYSISRYSHNPYHVPTHISYQLRNEGDKHTRLPNIAQREWLDPSEDIAPNPDLPNKISQPPTRIDNQNPQPGSFGINKIHKPTDNVPIPEKVPVMVPEKVPIHIPIPETVPVMIPGKVPEHIPGPETVPVMIPEHVLNNIKSIEKKRKQEEKRKILSILLSGGSDESDESSEETIVQLPVPLPLPLPLPFPLPRPVPAPLQPQSEKKKIIKPRPISNQQKILHDGTNIKRKITPTCRCGTPQKRRVIKGIPTQIHKYPWMILQITSTGDEPYCGGTLINDQFILTAAHCLDGVSPDTMYVTVGHSNANNPGTNYTVEKFIKHASYDPYKFEKYDIALIKLSKKLTFSEDFIPRPICLPRKDTSYNHETGDITGWGVYDNSNKISDKLRRASVTIWEYEKCKKESYYQDSDINPYVLCGHGKQSDTCQGDSGGPLKVRRGGIYYQAGITSWGYGCADKYYPGVYTKVSKYIDWINENTPGATYCSVPSLRKEDGDIHKEENILYNESPPTQ